MEAQFLKNIQEVANQETYDAFLKLLKDRSDDKISISQLATEVVELFQAYPELLDKFKTFLPKEGKLIAEQQIKLLKEKGKLVAEPSMNKMQGDAKLFIQRIKEFYTKQPAIYEEFLSLVKDFSIKKIKFSTVISKLTDIFHDHPEHIDSFSEFMTDDKKAKLRKVAEELRNVKKYDITRRDRPPKRNNTKRNNDYDYAIEMEDIDIEKYDRYGSSYIILPDNIKKRSCSARTELENSVLNDTMVCLPSGREGSFKDSLKNPYEEVLFRVEDDEYQLDTLIGRAQSLARKLEELEKIITETPDRITPSDYIKKNFYPFHDVILKTIFKEKASDIRSQLEWNTLSCIKSVLHTVVQQADSWIKSRRVLGKIWHTEFSKNWLKSLDHQSLIFHGKDEKETSPKYLIAHLRKTLFEHIMDEKVADYHEVLAFRSKKTKTIDTTIYDMTCDILDLCAEDCSKEEKEEISNLLRGRIRKLIYSPNKTVFYGNKDYYLVIKSLHIIVSRLNLAQDIAGDEAKPFWDIQGRFLPPKDSTTHVELSRTSTEDVRGEPKKEEFPIVVGLPDKQENSQEMEIQEPDQKGLQENPMDLFISYLKQSIEGTISPSDYEDRVLRLLGPKAFPLYTLQRIFLNTIQLVKQLFYNPHYESMNANYDRYVKSLEEQNHDQSLHIYERSARNVGAGSERAIKFTFYYFEDVKVLILLYPCDESPYSDLYRWRQYIRQYLLQESHLLDVRERRIFLNRNKIKTTKKNVQKDVIEINNLNGRIEKFTYRIVYCEGTEDFLFRTSRYKRKRTFNLVNKTNEL